MQDTGGRMGNGLQMCQGMNASRSLGGAPRGAETGDVLAAASAVYSRVLYRY